MQARFIRAYKAFAHHWLQVCSVTECFFLTQLLLRAAKAEPVESGFEP